MASDWHPEQKHWQNMETPMIRAMSLSSSPAPVNLSFHVQPKMSTATNYDFVNFIYNWINCVWNLTFLLQFTQLRRSPSFQYASTRDNHHQGQWPHTDLLGQRSSSTDATLVLQRQSAGWEQVRPADSGQERQGVIEGHQNRWKWFRDV